MEKTDQLNPDVAINNSKGHENSDNNNEKPDLKGQKKSVSNENGLSAEPENSDNQEMTVSSEKGASSSETKEKEKKSAKKKLQETVEDQAEDQKEEDNKAGTKGSAAKKEKTKVNESDNPAAEGEDNLNEKYSGLSKEELVTAIEELVENEDVTHIRKHIGYIKASFRKVLKEENVEDFEKTIGKQKESDIKQGDELTYRFDEAFEKYKKKKATYDKGLEKQKQENLVAKEKILEELRQLIESDEELKHTYDMFRELQDKWKQTGIVPQNSKSTLWKNYHFLVEKFFDKVKINKELKNLDLKKNLAAKTELCEKAEELFLESSINKSFKKLQELHETWKETGPVPKDKNDEIWERFKAATDKLNKRRLEYYQDIRVQQEKNYSAKLELCEKAEAILEMEPDSPKKWQENSEKMNELFKVWKTIGFVPRKVNDEIWNRFRTTLDAFFKKKKDFFKSYKEQQNENYNQKLNLCMQAEALKDNDDWKNTTDRLIELQKEWKKIGPVPTKFSDKIWKRFRAAFDEFFKRKEDYFSNINKHQDDNLKKKLDLIETIKTYDYSDDKNENLEILKNFQQEWMEIGYVPIKEKEKVQNEFRKTIDKQFENLNIGKKVKNTMAYRNKMENLKETPNSENKIKKEKSFLINKINNLKNDIKLWENNIGFFASTKNANVLKAEFEQKIDNAKQEIEVIEEKLKILNDI